MMARERFGECGPCWPSPGQLRARPLLGAGPTSLRAGELRQGTPHANLFLNAGHGGEPSKLEVENLHLALKER